MSSIALIAIFAGVAVCAVIVALVAMKNRAAETDSAVKPTVKEEPEKTEPVKTEPVKEEPKAEAPVEAQPIEEPKSVEVVKEEPKSVAPAEPIKAEPVKTEPVKEEPKAYIKPCAAATVTQAAAKKQPEINKDFMSKLVASKDASDKAAEIPYWVPPAAPAKAPVDPEPVKEEPKAEGPTEAQPIEEPEVVETVKEEPKSEVPVDPEPVKEEPKAEEPTEAQPIEEPEEVPADSVESAGDSPIDTESNLEDDTYTDYSPEALVRRAAWNKGLRCRRQYGDHSIQVAFVKPKVAVYVLDPSETIADEDAVKEEGWTVLRFDMNKVTDGLTEGDVIADAVKANLHAQKASKKKSGKK